METLRQPCQHLPSLALDCLQTRHWLLLLMVIFEPLERFCARRPQKLLRKAFSRGSEYFLSSLTPRLLLSYDQPADASAVVESELTFAYFHAARAYLQAWGKPVAFYSDNHPGALGGDGMTQFGQGAIIENKRLSAALAFIREQQLRREPLRRSTKAPRRRDQRDARLFKVG